MGDVNEVKPEAGEELVELARENRKRKFTRTHAILLGALLLITAVCAVYLYVNLSDTKALSYCQALPALRTSVEKCLRSGGAPVCSCSNSGVVINWSG